MIELQHVYKTYDGRIHALKNIQLTVEKGEFVFLTGPSGAGKTTLFKMICGFDRVSSGQISVAGFDLLSLTAKSIPDFRKKLGVVYQDFKILKERTVFQNVALPLEIRRESPEQIVKKVQEVLTQVGLIDKSDEFPEMLSGGEQQRIAIARALVHRPAVLIADEPTGNLDPKLSEEIIDLLERICVHGTTVFVATHDHDLVRRRKKRTLEIINGEICETQL